MNLGYREITCQKGKKMSHSRLVNTPIGVVQITEENQCITGVFLVSEDKQEKVKNTMAENSLLIKAEKQLKEYFAKERTTFDLPIRLQGTEFQTKVWNALQQIPYGRTCSYGDLAKIIGNPKASRAVGGANNKNPVMIIVPCHRVIGANGTMVGFGAGLDVKKYLLELEQRGLAEHE